MKQKSIRTLPVIWYAYSTDGVKLQYRNFENNPVVLYLPKDFEKKYYRFVKAPKNSGSIQGLPVLIVHLKEGKVTFIDIYTQYMKKKALIAEFTAQDKEMFQKAKEKGTVDIQF